MLLNRRDQERRVRSLVRQLFAQYDELRLESFADNLTANAVYTACGWRERGSLESEGLAKIEFVRHRETALTS
ncbi:GNAT family N-acetyltransferase [Streptomyces sp. NPDC005407]|uniref:GNAT family N-acetyltransferase n=1 Tax=Streptomyces sp. NPDC005407 TaxID=3155340 RepID=UPI0033A65270